MGTTLPVEWQVLPWHQVTSLRCGVGALRLCLCRDWEQLGEIIRQHPGLAILGGGTNTLGSDQDYHPKAGCLRLLTTGAISDHITIQDGQITVQGGCTLAGVIDYLARAGWGGMAPLAGIPGSIGGAAAMNAGANGSDLSQFIVALQGVDCRTGQQWQWRAEEGGFGYRTSPVTSGILVTKVIFLLKQVEPTAELTAIAEERARRRQVTPPGFSAGSVFRNPPGDKSAGWLLDQCGCRGLAQGELMVSPRHANWIVNPNGTPAKSADALALINEMRRRVEERFGITLHLEWRLAENMQ